MDSLKFHPGPPCLTLLCPAGGPPHKQPYGCFRGGPPAGRAACGHLLPPWTLCAYAAKSVQRKGSNTTKMKEEEKRNREKGRKTEESRTDHLYIVPDVKKDGSKVALLGGKL
jgi:hypothetical protein